MLARASRRSLGREEEEEEEEEGQYLSPFSMHSHSKHTKPMLFMFLNFQELYSQFPNLEDDAKAEPRGLLRGIAKLIGFIVGAVIFVVVVCCVCCFCCPFCLFSKHRNGRVIRRNDQAQEQQNLQQVEFRFFKENNF